MEKFSAQYFGKTKKIIVDNNCKSIVTIQFFQNQNNVVLAGINEILKLLQQETNILQYSIKYLPEGSIIQAKEVVLEIEGHYEYFGIYEGIIDGILARASSLASNARRIVEAANGKQVICMADRADHYRNQVGDGYAFALGGIQTQVTNAQVENHDGQAVGTIPHALIQMFEGDLVKTLEAYHKTFPNDDLVALVDFNNDVISDSLKAFQKFGNKLKAIRVDTSSSISDAMFLNNEEFGVTPNMIKRLRKALDKVEAQHIKIIVSSGLTPTKIKSFENAQTPIDVYGVGAYLLKIRHFFTADAVKLNGKFIAKSGRKYKPNTKLIKL